MSTPLTPPAPDLVEVPVTQVTPNTTISDPDTRRHLTNALGTVSILAALASLFFSTFPEATFGTDIPMRAVAFINGAVSLLAGAYNLLVVRPNIPRGE